MLRKVMADTVKVEVLSSHQTRQYLSEVFPIIEQILQDYDLPSPEEPITQSSLRR